MKKMLLLLLALSFVMPAWAGDVQPAQPSSAQATQLPPETRTGPSILESALGVVVKDAYAASCPVTCKTMNCPPPNGTVKLCCPKYPYTQTCP